MKTVNICGIPYSVTLCKDCFDVDLHFGQVDYKDCIIKINQDTHPNQQRETLCHEMVHAILVHTGYSELSQDEKFVQALGNAIYQGFDVIMKEE